MTITLDDVQHVADVYLVPIGACDDYTKVGSETMEKIKTAMDAAGVKYAVALQVAAA